MGQFIDANNDDDNNDLDFKVGDIVVAANGMKPVGGMAQYMIIEKK